MAIASIIASNIARAGEDRRESATARGECGLERRDELDRFLAGVERRAFRIAEFATHDRDEALDLVQDAMTSLVAHYAARPITDWAPLFHRILQNRIRDWSRRRSIRDRLRKWLGDASEDGGAADPIAEIADANARNPAEEASRAELGLRLDAALRALPLRQRQAFLLRAWEGLDVAQTATAMRCSQGSVKTHYFRALQNLRARLGEDRA